MNAQPVININTICNFVVAFFETGLPREQAVFALSRDFGFDLDEEEIASGLLAPSPIPASQAPSGIAPDEFDDAYGWFIA